MKNKYLLFYLCLIVLVFFGLPNAILFAKSGILKYIPFLLIFIPAPYLLYRSLEQFKLKNNICINIAIGSIFIIGPTFGIWSDFKTEQELNSNGKITIGIISKKWYDKNYRDFDGEWLYQVRFKVDNKNYHTYSEVDKLNKLNKGDSIKVRYSLINPEINKIIKIH